MAAPAPALGSLLPQDTVPRLCALLRDIRAEAQNLQASLAEIRKKASLTDAKTRAQEIAAALQDAAAVLARNRTAIDSRLAEVRGIFKVNAQEYDWCGDEVTEVENNWERIVAGWPAAGEQAEDALRRLAAVDGWLDGAIYHCAALTIPRRLNACLENLRVGQPLDFHTAFQDELPNKNQLQKVLDDLARQPGAVEGVIDAPKGLVYRISPYVWRRRASPFLLTLAGLSGFLLVWLFAHLGDLLSLSGWPANKDQTGELAIAYLFLVLGSLAHLGVDALKESRAGGSRFIALEDWILWLHVRESAILWGVLYLWVGFFGLAWSFRSLNWQTAFFAGYSIDSLVDLFLDRFQKLASAKTAEITKGLA